MKEPQVLRSRKHSKHSSLHKIKILCSFNGAFVRRSNSDRVRYVGGETKIIKVDRDSGISNLLSKTCEFFPDPKPSHLDVAFRYHVPASNVDDNKWNLVSITTDDDVRAMVREYDNLMIRNKMSKIRLFVFDVRSCKYLNLDSFSFPRFEIIGNLNMVERLNQEFSEAHLNRERKGGTFHSPMASQASRFPKSYDQLQSTKEGYLTYVAHIKNSGLKSQSGSYRNQFITYTPEILTNNHRFEGNNLCKNTNSKIRTIAVRNANPIDMRNHLRNDVLNVPKIHRIFKTDGKSNILLDPVTLGDQLSFSETIYDLPNIEYDPRCNSFSPQSSSKATENTNLDGHGYPLIDLGPKESNISTVKYNERKQEVESQVYQLNLKDDEQNILKSSKEKFSAIDSSNIVFSLWSASTIDGSGSKVSPESLPKYPDGSSKDITCVVSQKEKANRDTDKICSIEVDKANRQLMTIFTHLASQELQIIKNEDIEEIRRLGSGTYGTVFYGKWKGSDVAVKRIKPRCFTGSELEKEKLIANFWKEARLLAQLHHPNVLAFYGVITNGPGQTLATVSEFMVNGSLKQVLSRKDRTIDRRKRVIIATDAAIAMEYLHEKNVVHFDLKSGNLLMNMRDPLHPVCKIGDLGLSKVKQKTLISGGFRGTLPWMAPELLHETNMVTEKVDVYSFGIVMWELLTGEEPYANMQSEEILAGILKGNLRPEIPCWCDPSWRSLMKRCWSSDPNLRPSFQDIAKELLSMSSSMNIKY